VRGWHTYQFLFVVVVVVVNFTMSMILFFCIACERQGWAEVSFFRWRLAFLFLGCIGLCSFVRLVIPLEGCGNSSRQVKQCFRL
jgi:hypothetical protein